MWNMGLLISPYAEAEYKQNNIARHLTTLTRRRLLNLGPPIHMCEGLVSPGIDIFASTWHEVGWKVSTRVRSTCELIAMVCLVLTC